MMHEIFEGSVTAIKAYVKDHEEEILEGFNTWSSWFEKDARKAVQALGKSLEKARSKRVEEILRVQKLYANDAAYGEIVCGVDEVGRGPLAGPIVGAAVILQDGSSIREEILGIDDSKKLSKKRREELAKIIQEKAVSYAIYEMSNVDIDRLGIAYCNHEVFRGAIRLLTVKPQIVLSDGYLIKEYTGKNVSLIKGDAKSAAIACASILAKVHRDQLMERLSVFYPAYDFQHNVGYGSASHLAALEEFGPTPLHRRTFLTKILGPKEVER